MAIQFQTASLSFGRGIDTKTTEYQVQPPFLLDLQNGVLDEGGNIGKRNGTVSLRTDIIGGGNIEQGQHLATLRDQLVAFDGMNAYAYMPQASAWINRGRCVRTQAQNRTIFTTAASQSHVVSAYANNVGVFAWDDTRGGVRASIIDYASGTPYLVDVALNASGERPRVVATPSTLVIVYGVGNTLRTRVVYTSNPTAFSTETTVYSDYNGGGAKIIDAIPFYDNVLVIYQDNPTTQGRVAYITANGQSYLSGLLAPPQSVALIPNGPLVLENITIDGTDYALAMGSNIGVGTLYGRFLRRGLTTFAVLPVSIATPNAAQNITTCTQPNGNMLSGYEVVVFWEERVAGTPTVYTITLDANEFFGLPFTPRTSITTVAYRCALAGAAFVLNGVTVCPVVYNSQVQATLFLLDRNGAIVSRHLPSLAGAIPSTLGSLPHPQATDDTTITLPVRQSGTLTSDNGTFTTTTNVAELMLKVGTDAPFNSAIQGNNLYVAGAQLLLYDGVSLVEDGFHIFPEGIVLSAQPAGGLTVGTRQYVQVYAWIDARGQIHRSAPSLPFSVTNAAATQNTLALPTLALTQKSGVFIELYRTVAAGTVYYKLTSSTSPVANNPAVATIAYADNALDANITSNEILYTNGSILPHDAAPALRQVVTFENRLVGLSAEADNLLYYSQEYTQGQGVAWSLALTKNVPAIGGVAATVAAMDDKCIVFKPNNSFYYYGNGPTPSGGNDQFSPITLLSADVGCSLQNSIVLTAEGLMFQSNKGIRLLDRQLQQSYPGAPVAAYDGIPCTSAVMVQDQNQVRFTSATDRALVYDYYWRGPSPSGQDAIGQWSTWTNHMAVSATLWQGTYCHLSSVGKVYQETAEVFTDDGAFIPLLVKTAWQAPAGTQAWFRLGKCALLGTYYSPHLLKVTLAYDYGQDVEPFYWDAPASLLGETFGSDATFGASPVYGGSVDPLVYQVRINPSRQRIQSVRFTFEDMPYPDGDYGQSFSINNLALTFGAVGGIKRLSNAKTAR